MNNTLHIITVIFNPAGYEKRYQLYREFITHVSSFPGVKIYTVELAIGNQEFQVTNSDNPYNLQLRTYQQMWFKENLVNIAVKNLLPDDWQYVAWIDADIEFENFNWVKETVEKLKKYDVVQPFSTALDMGKHGNIISIWKSFGYVNNESIIEPYLEVEPNKFNAAKVTPGFAWACDRYAWETMNGLLDRCIIGSGDYHMAMALVGRIQETFHCDDLTEYNERLLKWQESVSELKLGYVEGVIKHKWHGERKNRKYKERRKIIEDHKFNPYKHVGYHSSGLMFLIGSAIDMIESIAEYFLGRKEDK